jgi:murein DD-endopeptidase MepM/ murein hydrolase activator NlpD
MLKKLTAVLIVTIIMFNSIIVHGTTVNELRQQQQSNIEEAQEIADELNNTRAEIRSTRSEFDNIDFELQILTSELEAITLRLEEINRELYLAEIELEQSILNKEAQNEIFEERLRIMYIHGRKGYLDILLDSRSISDFFARVVYMTKIIRFDQSLIMDMSNTKNAIVEQREIILTNMSYAEILLIEQTEKTAALEEALLEKEQLLIALYADEQRYLAESAIMEQSNREIEELILRKQRQSLNNNTHRSGELTWPVPTHSRISSGFGYRTSPITGRGEHHNGLDIPAPSGTSIVAAESGVVIFAGTQSGFGNTVIIDHGGGFTTLYAHMSSIQVSVGQQVSRGEHIARVGTTGWSTGNHLHFETRTNGRPHNPMNYFN